LNKLLGLTVLFAKSKQANGETKASADARNVSARSVVVGVLLSAGLCVVTPYTDLVMRTSLIACDHLPIGVLTVFLLLILVVNPVLRRLPFRRPFSPAELITIYAMMLVTAGIPSFGLVDYLFPVITAPFYYSTPQNGWSTMFGKYIPAWLAPRDPTAINRYYEGLKTSEAIPWDVWLKPLVGWSIFVLALYLVIACLAAILRRQWVERERLVFPLVQLPLEMAQDETRSGGNPFLRNKILWFGVSIPVLVHGWNSLNTYFPTIPTMQLKWIEITAALADYAPWSALRPIYVFVYFSVIGFAYLLSSEVALGLVVFYFFYKVQAVFALAIGYNDPWTYGYLGPGYLAHQGAGAVLIIVASSLWMARNHLSDVIGCALGRSKVHADREEPLSYRFACGGLLIGTIVLVVWCTIAGMSPAVAVLLILLLYVVMIALAKFVADSGLLFVQSPFQPGDLLSTALGTARLGATNLVLLGMIQFIFMFDLRSFMMPSMMDGFKMSDGVGLRRRSLFGAMALAIVVGLVVSYISAIAWTYHTGGLKMNSWFFQSANRVPFARAADQMLNFKPTNLNNLAFTAMGAIICAIVTFLRQRYVWWPFHPIGYALGSTFPMTQMWMPILVGWMLKGIILRYSGRKGYVKARPFFLGLILGEFGISGLWIPVDLVLGVRGHTIFPN
jgi:hypothetical protein